MIEGGGKIKKRVKPDLPGGFRDYGPQEMRLKQWILDTARATFESFGFEPLETSSVQKTDVLTGGEADSDKIIYRIRPAQRGEVVGEEARDENSLRFDLTVPLARFVATNPDIAKPFKRYEIGRVWRGERQQAGRYREFTQADVDIVGAQSPAADAEIVALIYTTLKNLGMENFKIKINSRELLDELPILCNFKKEALWPVLRAIDRIDKVGWQGIEKEVQQIIGSESTALVRELFNWFQQARDTTSITLNGRTLGKEASTKLYQIGELLEGMGMKRGANWDFDISMVRGLSYYTGPVFETVLTDAPEIGSVFGGGRYDDLVMSFTGQKIPAVGVSLGVDRLIAARERLGVGTISVVQSPQALVFNLVPGAEVEYLAMAAEVREAGIGCSVYLGDETTFQAQLAYALKKEMAYAIIRGEEERTKGTVSIKNLATREQTEIPREQLRSYFKK